MFERFTTPARETVLRAKVEARELDSSVTGTEHLLLALLHQDAGLAYAVLRDAGIDAESVRAQVRRSASRAALLGPEDAAALRQIGIDLDAVLARIEDSFGPDALDRVGPPPAGPGRSGRRRRYPATGFAPRSKKVLELALREALRLRHRYIGTEHILLGLIRDGHGPAAEILIRGGVDLAGLRDAIESQLRQPA
ncbi:MAG: Clp protease [Micromonosporaceae bacterium]|nr:Clp protease [Micromonosporaceae bacterium]